MTVTISERPRKYLSFSIHAPGFGKKRSVVGKKAVRRKGKARPKPIMKNIRKIVKVPAVKAKVKAVPRNGAEQGVERIVVRTPLKKSPTRLSSVFADPSLDPPGVTNSKSPKRLRLRMKRISIMIRMKAGDCSWKPHPISSPVALMARTIPAKAMNVPMTPAAYVRLCERSRARGVSRCLMRPKSFMEITGSTQGMRLRIRPPRKAKRR